MYIDGDQATRIIVALLTFANTALLVWQARTVAAVHTKVNGLTQGAITAAELAGYARGAGTTPPAPPPLPPPPGQ